MNLAGKAALVTGGAHRVGRAIALELARAGADIIVHYGRSADEAEKTASEIQALGRRCLLCSADLREVEEAVETLTQAAEAMGRLDVLVNSAASFKKQSLPKVQPEDWDASQAVNVRAPFFLVQSLAEFMRASDLPDGQAGCIVNISDLSAVQAWSSYIQHGVSKAGILHLTRILARELAPDLRVNAILPGAILPPPGVSSDSELWKKIGSASPLGRPGRPAFVAQTVRFFCENDYITGSALPVDGGEHLLGPVNH